MQPPRAPSRPSLEVAEDIGLRSVVAAPLIARGELLGVFSLVFSQLSGLNSRRFAQSDSIPTTASTVVTTITASTKISRRREIEDPCSDSRGSLVSVGAESPACGASPEPGP